MKIYRELVFVGNGVDVAVVDVAQLVGQFGDLVKVGGKQGERLYLRRNLKWFMIFFRRYKGFRISYRNFDYHTNGLKSNYKLGSRYPYNKYRHGQVSQFGHHQHRGCTVRIESVWMMVTLEKGVPIYLLVRIPVYFISTFEKNADSRDAKWPKPNRARRRSRFRGPTRRWGWGCDALMTWQLMRPPTFLR
jgi:hypothetical protein